MKSCRQTKFIGLLSIGLAILLLLMSSMMMMAIPVNAFMPEVHSDINVKSLSFLKPDIISKINSGDEGADKIEEFGHREYHSIGCDFQGTTENINSLYGQVVSSIDDKDTMAKTFGLLLHPVQDFYAHSNWIELGRDDLIESSSDSKWPVLKPFQEYKGVIIVQVGDERKGEHYDIPDGYTLDRDDKVVHVSTSDGAYPGLISATSTEYKNNCPYEDMSITHREINKDSESREGYDKARSLAEAQTINEWCRLQNLVEQSHGQDGVQLLINSWVDDKHKANSVCLDDDSSLANNDVGSDGGGDTDTGDDGGDGGDGGGGGDGGDGGGGGDGFIWPKLINTKED
jgi:hypothetical protein